MRPSLRRVLESMRTSHEPRVRVGASRRNGPRVRQRGGGAAPLRTLEGEEIHTPSPLHLRAAVQHAYRHFSSSMSIDTTTPHQHTGEPSRASQTAPTALCTTLSTVHTLYIPCSCSVFCTTIVSSLATIRWYAGRLEPCDCLVLATTRSA